MFRLSDPSRSGIDASPALPRPRCSPPAIEVPKAILAVLDQIPDMILIADERQRFAWANRAACRLLRVPRAMIVGRAISELSDPSFRSRLDRLWRKLMVEGRLAGEWRFRFPDGRTCDIEFNARAHFLPGLHLGCCRDVTERKKTEASIRRLTDQLERRVSDRTRQLEQLNRKLHTDLARRRTAESALRQSKDRYRGLFTQANDGILTFDPRNGRVLEANRRALRIFGFSRREFLGRSLSTLALDPRQWRREVRAIMRAGTLSNLEVHRRRKRGERIVLAVNAAVINHDGRQVVLKTMRDVTERRRIEQALRESEQRLRAAMEGSRDPIYFLSSVRNPCGRVTDFRIVDLNSCGEERLARPRRRLLGALLCREFPITRTSGFFDRYVRVVETREPAEGEVFLRGPGVKERWIRYQALPLGDGVAVTTRDVSAHKRAEQTLRELPQQIFKVQEAERRRVARELHDGVSQLLTAARFRLHALEAKLAGGRAVRRAVARIRRMLEGARDEVRRISRGLRPSELDDLGLVPALRGLIVEFAQRTGVRPSLRCPRRRLALPPEAEGVLYRVTQEALTNVERHARARRVAIELRRRASAVVFSITDDGCGFATSADAGARSGSRRGHGLLNMRERVSLAGGRFSVESAAGEGTGIVVEIPLPVVNGTARPAPHG